VLDGWWLEGYREGAGWALTEKRTYQNQEQQDQLDAATIYGLLENEILPLYYARNAKGYSEGWIRTVKNSIAQVAPHYTMKRQLDDYYTKFYTPLAERAKILFADNYKKAKEIALWKEQVAERWETINVVSVKKDPIDDGIFESGKHYKIQYVIDEQGLDDVVGLEIVVTHTDEEGKTHVTGKYPLQVVKREGNNFTFEGTLALPNAGAFKLAYRMYPKNADLPHRQDFCYVKWIY
jgi:starch phosphorylase